MGLYVCRGGMEWIVHMDCIWISSYLGILYTNQIILNNQIRLCEAFFVQDVYFCILDDVLGLLRWVVIPIWSIS